MTAHPQSAPATVRSAAPADAQRIAAALSAQLGYPTAPEDVVRRIAALQGREDHVVGIALAPGEKIVGWVHVAVTPLVHANQQAEVLALVVDESHRRSGAGRLLMKFAEEWARSKSCAIIRLRSNVVREGCARLLSPARLRGVQDIQELPQMPVRPQ